MRHNEYTYTRAPRSIGIFALDEVRTIGPFSSLLRITPVFLRSTGTGHTGCSHGVNRADAVSPSQNTGSPIRQVQALLFPLIGHNVAEPSHNY